MLQNNKILEINNLKKHFNKSSNILFKKAKPVKAVDGISFYINRGETFGLVGESGCGKSTTGRTIIRLYDVTDGSVIIDGVDISKLKGKELFKYRKKLQIIFQDPYASLNTRMTVEEIIGESIETHKLYKGEAKKNRIKDLLKMVGLNSSHMNRYPHEFSGGQRQRIGIARALAVEPEIIICDEPISALDVSIQAQVVNMLKELQEKLNLTYLFIAHDLAMVKYISDRIAVMYLGKIVEIAKSDDLYESPMHPYTKALLSAIPVADPNANKIKNRVVLEGEVPSPINPPSGCRFRTRCSYVMDICKKEEPKMKEISDSHFVACHLFK